MDKLFEMINQEFEAQGSKLSSVAKFWDLLHGARGLKVAMLSRMHAQFLLCNTGLEFSKTNCQQACTISGE